MNSSAAGRDVSTLLPGDRARERKILRNLVGIAGVCEKVKGEKFSGQFLVPEPIYLCSSGKQKGSKFHGEFCDAAQNLN